ncbi:MULTISPECIES: GGDEF domain-containing protein [unclassified Colwellia]|uniref:GGDEF domain-containing protein n=1 Tax=unclassified Colwellia TaxID=196834 RepID=UPI0015F38831|nr:MULTISPECIES: GGDEF domain-containing protein [unclassified Colwellia]MBA6351527.1 GGDEF domain-containing protein [Colwellia sp. BRX9-1]MBA6354759.1 GGDEF domain-containing protein [Colwellia sp. BRX8-3]MBA6359979.1 GGDEF domain-containing protein [Colwellia sp. BRX8-6]MBA6366454.1 GGDEF domain-containing protein [Colwellia sp. BRX8-5]MBA6376183.1 GGDEF domain-containing protein [Colwellia sp. BRX8-2]
MNTDLLNYVNFPALIINEQGTVVSRSKHIKHKYHINEGDDFFALCDSKVSLSEFILNISNMPLGSNDKCLTHFSFIQKNIEVYVSIISKQPILFLIEYSAELLQDSSVVDLVDHSNNLLSLVDKNYHYLSVNEQYSLKWGLQKADIINQHVITVLGEEAFNKVVKKELDLCFSGKVRTYTDWFYSENKKQMLFLKVAYQPVFDSHSDQVNSVAVTVTDITDIQVLNEKLTEQAFHDPLTTLDNRYALMAYFDKLSATLTRNDCYSLVMIDLDDFKRVNDSYGHNIGDELLKAFAVNLKNTLRADDFCCRWGGDEFVLLLAQGNTAQTLVTARYNINDRFQQLQEKVYQVAKHKLSLRFSFGLALFPQQSKSLEQLISIADSKMYRDKKLQKLS